MNILESFEFSGDAFYQNPTVVPFTKGITLLRGINYDAGPNADNSNGAGKTRIPQLLKAFVYNKCDRGILKQLVKKNFIGTLKFHNTLTDERWAFTADVKENEWQILCNGKQYIDHHKFSECQKKLAEQILLSNKEWSHFVHITRKGISSFLEGKDEERRNFLEEFFCIDDFYAEKLVEYKELLAAQEKDIEKLEQDRARYTQVLASLQEAEDVTQLTERLSAITLQLSECRNKAGAIQTQVLTLREHLSDWTRYYQASLDAEGLPPLPELEARTQEVQRKLVEAENLRKTIDEVQRKVVALPVAEEEPKAPLQVEVTVSDVVASEKLLMQMLEKQKLIDRFKEIKSGMPVVTTNKTDLLAEKDKLLSDVSNIRLHLSLVKDGKSCSRCGQSIDFILQDKSVEDRHVALAEEERSLLTRLAEVNRTLSELDRKSAMEGEMQRVKDAALAYPKFDNTIEQVKEKLEKDRRAEQDWKIYRVNKSEYDRKVYARGKLLAELSALGYPDILKVPVPCLTTLNETLRKLSADVALQQLVHTLRLRVISYPEKAEVASVLSEKEGEAKALEDEIGILLGEEGACKAKLSYSQSLLSAKEDLEKKLSHSEELYNQYRILKALVKFFSPSGFKNYELRQRCKPLIDKANYWSPLFFSERHEWSLSKDEDSVDFLVQPVAHRKSVVPFPARYLSAGEGNRAERVLLFAKLEMFPKHKACSVVFLDEIEGHLDAAGRTLFTEVVIPKLRETFSDRCIVIISHDDSLKNLACIDHLWLVERRNRISTLKVFENAGGNVA